MAARPSTVAALLSAQARDQGDRAALVDGSLRLSYLELDLAVTRAARALLGAGLGAGDRVVLQLSGSDLVVLYLAASRAGVVAIPVNPAYTAPELASVVSDSGAGLVISSGQPNADVRVIAGAQLTDFLASGPDVDLPEVPADALAVLLYTSGTTGHPRGAMLTSNALLANLEQVAALEPATITGEDVVFVPIPLFHIFGLNAGLGVALHSGATLVLGDRFDPAPTLQTMAAEHVTAVAGVPTMFAAWLPEPGFDAGFEYVSFAWSGSAALAPGLVQAYADRGVELFEGYGLTETAPVITVQLVGRWPGRRFGWLAGSWRRGRAAHRRRRAAAPPRSRRDLRPRSERLRRVLAGWRRGTGRGRLVRDRRPGRPRRRRQPPAGRADERSGDRQRIQRVPGRGRRRPAQPRRGGGSGRRGCARCGQRRGGDRLRRPASGTTVSMPTTSLPPRPRAWPATSCRGGSRSSTSCPTPSPARS